MFQRLSVFVGVGMCVLATVAMAEDLEASKTRVNQQEIASLRARGAEGLDEALANYDKLLGQFGRLQEEVNRLNLAGAEGNKETIAAIERQQAELEPQLAGWRAAIDEIGGQRTCAVSRLFWYTDLAEAQAAAERTGRPILSLRMLGKLTDEYSCANSRFFRTTLYSNQDISAYLRDHFVLHWQSVRPVPRVTIDFGDGRKLERTLTGNSAHYVLSAQGQPLDVLPGLYSPNQFKSWLEQMAAFHRTYVDTPDAERPAALQAYHSTMRDSVLRRWNMDIGRLGAARAAAVVHRIDGALASARSAGEEAPAALPENAAPEAVKAARLAGSKTVVEAPVFRLANLGGRWMERGMDEELWQAVADLHREGVKLDEASVAVMRQEFPAAAAAARVAIHKSRQEDPILRVVRTFENSISLDTVRNEYLLHRRVHERFVAAAGLPETANVDSLNEWVYAALFLTPSSDPWLGLAPPDVYTALENDGRMEAKADAAQQAGG